MSRFINLIEKRFERLIVIEQASNSKNGRVRWLCQCDCGKETIVLGYNLKSGSTKSCGCLLKEGNNTKHGHSKKQKTSKIYRIWDSMIQRCTNSNNIGYKNYGGREIIVCDRWKNSFENFLKDMPNWKPGLTLERNKNELGYFKDNCEWATYTKQARNRRNNLYVIYNMKRQLLIELCEKYNMSYKLIYDRIYRYGWSPKEALTTPVGQRRKKP